MAPRWFRFSLQVKPIPGAAILLRGAAPPPAKPTALLRLRYYTREAEREPRGRVPKPWDPALKPSVDFRHFKIHKYPLKLTQPVIAFSLLKWNFVVNTVFNIKKSGSVEQQQVWLHQVSTSGGMKCIKPPENISQTLRLTHEASVLP